MFIKTFARVVWWSVLETAVILSLDSIGHLNYTGLIIPKSPYYEQK